MGAPPDFDTVCAPTIARTTTFPPVHERVMQGFSIMDKQPVGSAQTRAPTRARKSHSHAEIDVRPSRQGEDGAHRELLRRPGRHRRLDAECQKGKQSPCSDDNSCWFTGPGHDPWPARDSVAAARRLRCPNYEAANLERGCQAGACVGARRRSVEGASCRYCGLQENECSLSHRLAGVTEGSRGPSDSRLYHHSHHRDIRCVRPGPVHCTL